MLGKLVHAGDTDGGSQEDEDVPRDSRGSSPTRIEPENSTSAAESEEEEDEDLTFKIRSHTGRVVSFQILPNEPDGNCMFRALSQALCDSEARHADLRKEIVNYITGDPKWKDFYPFIRVQHEHLDLDPGEKTRKTKGSNSSHDQGPGPGVVNNNEPGVADPLQQEGQWRDEYRKYMSQDTVFGTLQELTAASELFKFNLVIVRMVSPGYFNIQTFKDQICDYTFFFLFTGSADDGHFQLIVPDYSNDPGYDTVRLRRGYYRHVEPDNDEDGYLIVEDISSSKDPDINNAVINVRSVDSFDSVKKRSLSLTLMHGMGGRSLAEIINESTGKLSDPSDAELELLTNFRKAPDETTKIQNLKLAESLVKILKTTPILPRKYSEDELSSPPMSPEGSKEWIPQVFSTDSKLSLREVRSSYQIPPKYYRRRRNKVHPSRESSRSPLLLASKAKPPEPVLRVGFLRQAWNSVLIGLDGLRVCFNCLWPS